MSKENTRRKIHPDIESVPTGFANGQAQGNPLTEEEKQLLENKLMQKEKVDIYIKWVV